VRNLTPGALFGLIIPMHTPTTARHLRAGDVIAGSGFVVTHNAYALTRTPKGRVVIEGYYPGSPVKAYEWSANTRVPVVVDSVSGTR
jgi:hypothetical protein